MKKIYFLPVILIFLCCIISCGEDSVSESPYINIDIYGVKDGNLYPTSSIPLPPDTVFREDSTVTETDTIYFDAIDTIYKVQVDSVYISSKADTLNFSIKTNCAWQFEFTPVYWDVIVNQGIISPNPLDWFVRPDKVTGGGNSFITVAVKKNDSNRKRAVLFYFKTKNPLTKSYFMITQAPNP